MRRSCVVSSLPALTPQSVPQPYALDVIAWGLQNSPIHLNRSWYLPKATETIIPAVAMVCVYLRLLPLQLKGKWLGGSRNIPLPWSYTAQGADKNLALTLHKRIQNVLGVFRM